MRRRLPQEVARLVRSAPPSATPSDAIALRTGLSSVESSVVSTGFKIASVLFATVVAFTPRPSTFTVRASELSNWLDKERLDDPALMICRRGITRSVADDGIDAVAVPVTFTRPVIVTI